MNHTKLLVRKILERATAYTWSVQGLGMLRLYLSPELRLHIWDSNYKVPNVSAIHDHPWDFVSEVVAGEILNRRFDPVENGQVYKRIPIKCGPGGCQLSEPDFVALHGPTTWVVKAGESYHQSADEIHYTDAPDGTITLVHRTKFNEDRDTANVYWKDGPWVSAEPRDATYDEVMDITQRSLKRWF